MIVYDLCCYQGHRFEGWFGSSADFAAQHARNLVTCPQCGAVADKAPMAPAVPKKGNQVAPAPTPSQAPGAQAMANGPMPPQVAEALHKLAEAQAAALKNSTWVGNAFAERSRAMHHGERDPETIHGQATPDEARALVDEGIAVSPLPFPVAPPEETN